ncbi:MAG: hypothetical protein ACREBC_34825, partial [Pyrinomonadaceae bacterium]
MLDYRVYQPELSKGDSDMVRYRFRFIALCILSVSCFVSPRIAVSEIPFDDRTKIMAHATDGNDKQGKPVTGIVARNHHKDEACKEAYKKVNGKEGTDDDRLTFVKNQVTTLGARGPQGTSPNGACHCYYNNNL